jgi:nucleotide-binding universal stress UspA family protein
VESPTGDPVQMIREAADEHDVDVIVVGSHDKSALRRIFDPSVAAGLIRATHRPVVVVSGDPPEPEL